MKELLDAAEMLGHTFETKKLAVCNAFMLFVFVES